MPHGKPAGVRCVNLDDTNRCRVWKTELFPAVCRGFLPLADVCGSSAADALTRIGELERLTRPAR
jgi:uncharacterized protein